MIAKTVIFDDDPDLPLYELDGFLPAGTFEKGARVKHAGLTYVVVDWETEIDDEIVLRIKVRQVDSSGSFAVY
jgi:hypothetical protein